MRSILVATILGAAVAIHAQDLTGFVSIFDGSTLKGWDGDPAYWHVEHESIVGETTVANPLKQNTFLIMQMINGSVTSIVVDDDERNRALSGLIGFQIHVGDPMKVEFRHVWLKTL